MKLRLFVCTRFVGNGMRRMQFLWLGFTSILFTGESQRVQCPENSCKALFCVTEDGVSICEQPRYHSPCKSAIPIAPSVKEPHYWLPNPYLAYPEVRFSLSYPVVNTVPGRHKQRRSLLMQIGNWEPTKYTQHRSPVGWNNESLGITYRNMSERLPRNGSENTCTTKDTLTCVAACESGNSGEHFIICR